jgi:hypothetical protein
MPQFEIEYRLVRRVRIHAMTARAAQTLLEKANPQAQVVSVMRTDLLPPDPPAAPSPPA